MEEKVNPAFHGLVTFSDLPQPHMMPKNYKAYAQEGYKGNDTIYKCINYIITNGAAIPPKLYTDDTKTKEIKSHPLLDKLKRPNIEQTGVEYREEVLGYFLVTGNTFQYAIRKGIAGPPDELWAFDPTKIKVLPTKVRGIVGYEFDDYDGSAQDPVPGQNPIPFQNVSHMKSWNPGDPVWGLSPIEVGAITVDMQTAYKKWNLGLTQNGGKMSGAFSTDIIMSGPDRQKVEDKINEKYAGPRNAGRIALLDGGLKWQSMSVTPSEMDWLPAMQYNAGGLANLLNIPPQLIGDTSSTTYDNMQEAKAASYTEEIFPVLDKFYAKETMWLVPMYSDLCDKQGNPVACLYYDKDSVEVVQAVIQTKMTAKSQRANASWLAGDIMLDEARALQDLPPLPKKAGQVFRIGAILVKLEDMDEFAEQSMKTPVAPPALVPENLLNAITGTPDPNAPADPNVDPKKPATKPKPKPGGTDDTIKPTGKPASNATDSSAHNAGKSHPVLSSVVDLEHKTLDAQGVYQPDDLLERLAAYKAQGVTKLQSISNGNPCSAMCLQNSGAIVEVGKPFPSGHLLEPFHPHCDCKTVPVAFTNSPKSQPKSIDEARQRKLLARKEYKEFVEATV